MFKNVVKRLGPLIPDKIFLKMQYRYHLGKKLDLENPKTFNEKIQWLKLNDRNPDYIVYVDKYAVRQHIKNVVGEEYLIPLIGVYNTVDEIDWDSLPNRFVLKCTHGSSSNIICQDKSKLNIEDSKKKLKEWMNRNWFWYGREWPYKHVKPKIICEKYLSEGDSTSLTDYKFFCFNGNPMYCQVIRGRGINETIDFYDVKWNHMPFTGLRELPMSSKQYEKPKKYEEMLKLAKILAGNFSFLRVDFYFVNDQIKFGELTFFPLSGFGKFTPNEWNYKLGSLIELPKI